MVAPDQLAVLKRAIAERRYDEAIHGARRLVLQWAHHPEARVILGQALLAADRFDEARVELLAFTKEHPEDAAGHRLLGEAHLRGGQVDAARDSLQRALALDPGDEGARELLAETDVDVAPMSATIERWFAAEEPTTTSQGSAFPLRGDPEEEATAATGAPVGGLRQLLEGAATSASAGKLEVELDPAYAVEVSSAELRIQSGDLRLPSTELLTEATSAGARNETAELALPELLPEATAVAAPKPSIKSTMLGVAAPVPSIKSTMLGGVTAPTPSVAPAPPPAAWSPTPRPPHPRPPTGAFTAGSGSLRPPTQPNVPPRPPAPPGSRPPTASFATVPDRSSPGSLAAPGETVSGRAPVKPPAPPRPPTGSIATSMRPPTGAIGTSPPPRPPTGSVRPPTGAIATGSVRPPTGAIATSSFPKPPPPRPPTGSFSTPPPRPPTGAVRAEATAAPSRPPTQRFPLPSGAPGSAASFPKPLDRPPSSAPAVLPRAAAHLEKGAPAAFAPTMVAPAHGASDDVYGEVEMTRALEAAKPVEAWPSALDGKASLPSKAPPPSGFGVGLGAPMPTGRGLATGNLPGKAAGLGAPMPSGVGPRPAPIGPSRSGLGAPMGTGSGRGFPAPFGTPPAPAPNPTTSSSVTGRSKATRPKSSKARAIQPRHVALAVAATIGAIGAAAFAIHRWVSTQARTAALELASDTGARSALEDAVARSDTDSAALYQAVLVVEHGDSSPLELGDSAGPEITIARSLLTLAGGDAATALALLQRGLEGNQLTLVEAFRARALALDALGRFSDAEVQAHSAEDQRPQAPRHACLYAREALLAGEPAVATAALAAVTQPDQHACVLMIRGWLALDRSEPAEADRLARLALADPERTAIDGAWAHYIAGRAALARADLVASRGEFAAAAETSPRMDETLLLRAIEGLLDARDPEGAQRASTRLVPNPPNGPRRAEVLVRLALDRNDTATGDALLGSLPPGPRTQLVQGLVREAQGRVDEALVNFAAAATDSTVGGRASLHQAQILLRLGRLDAARAALDTAARFSPNDAAISVALARLAVSQRDLRAARASVDAARRSHPDDPRLQSLDAVLRALGGQAEAALADARRIAQQVPADAEIQLDLARVARAAGDHATESTACTEALRIDPAHSGAKLCAARAAIEGADRELASRLLDELERAGALGLEVARLRAEFVVSESRGAAGLAPVRRLMNGHRDDIELLTAQARLHLQAEQYDEADGIARRLLATDPGQPEALLIRAAVAHDGGRLGTAVDLLDRAARELDEREANAPARARILARRGLIAFEDSRYGNARELAAEALRLDPACGNAHFLTALTRERDRNATREALTAAVEGTSAPAEAFARLAQLSPRGEGCAYARHYADAAPSGYDRRAVEELLRGCR